MTQSSLDSGPRKPCLGKCGFFGNSDTEGYCSFCFRWTCVLAKHMRGDLCAYICRRRLVGKDPSAEKTNCISSGCTNFGNPEKEKYCNKCWQELQDKKNGKFENQNTIKNLQFFSSRMVQSVLVACTTTSKAEAACDMDVSSGQLSQTCAKRSSKMLGLH